jgi:VanZ family protein
MVDRYINFSYAWKIWALLILVAILWPSKALIIPKAAWLTHIDKLIHFGMFGVLYFLVAKAIKPPQSNTQKVVSFVYVCLYAVFTEYLQLVLKDRSFDIFDIIANIMGATIAYLFFNRKQN